MGMHACNSSTQKTEARKSQIQGGSGIHGEFKASLGYIGRPCLKKKKRTVE
jgi:hypothetical protein